MTAHPEFLDADHWIAAFFNSQTAREGAVVRRKTRYVGREAFLAEMRRRGFAMVENAGQFVIFCNQDPIRRVA